MSVAEAGGAAELVFGVDVEMTCLAPVAPLTLNVLLAVAVAGGVVAAGSVLRTALGQTAASFAAERAEVPIVDFALKMKKKFNKL